VAKPLWRRNRLFRGKVSFALIQASAELFLPVAAGACTLIYPTLQAGPSFRVKVTDRGRPVEGLRLQLADSDFFDFEHQRTRHSVTDADGFAHFTNVSPDEYFLSADVDGSIGDGATVMVKPNGPSGVTVPLKWPNQEPLSVRSVRGTLSVPNYEPRLPPSHLSLSLLGGLSGRVLETTQSDSTGRFAFGEVPPGIYFLQLNPSGVKDRWTGEEITGLIAIEVSREADEEALDLDVGWSGCGFMYADRTRCSQDTLEVSKVCGYVYDITGAVIPNADIVLQEHIEDGKPLREAHTDTSGRFALQGVKEGMYQLAVRAPGFYQLRSTVQVRAANTSEGCERPITVRLGLAVSCSSAEAFGYK
jgi:hypothetical protein